MVFEPKPYQVEAMRFLLSRQHGGLTLAVGLGKSACSLHATVILRGKGAVTRTLIVAPLRALYQVWPLEIAKWDGTHHLTVSNLRDTPHRYADIELINPESLVKILEKYPGRWDHIIIDEASTFKNSQSQRFRKLRKVLPAFRHRWLLTGSPAPNSLMDIWALAFILDRGAALGDFITKFRNMFCIPAGWNSFQWMIRPGAEKEIYARLKPLFFRVGVAESGLKLPELIHNRITVELPPAARVKYEEMRKLFVTIVQNETLTSPSAATAGMRCRQIANGRIYGPDMTTLTVHDAKLDALCELVGEQQGEPLLILYEFRHDAAAILERLGPVPNLTAMTREKDINDLVTRWNKGEIPVMIGHPASIGKALNLQEACAAVCFYGTTWSLDNYEQSIGRVWRQGNPAQSVVVHHIIAIHTYDDVVLSVLSKKAKSQNDLNNALTHTGEKNGIPNHQEHNLRRAADPATLPFV